MIFEMAMTQERVEVFWLCQKSLPQRLRLIFPNVVFDDVDIVSRRLSSNAAFVNYVFLHQLIHKPTKTHHYIVEKSIKKICLVSSMESRFYKEDGMLNSSAYFSHPKCHATIETPLESVIFTEYLRGTPPRMNNIAYDLAEGIAEIESRTHAHLTSLTARATFKYWCMDFFRQWFFIRPRFNFQRRLKQLNRMMDYYYSPSLSNQNTSLLLSVTRQLEHNSIGSQKCFSHMDYLKKNIISSQSRLQLIDWSEFKIGRIGFDGGMYLSSIFRRHTLNSFVQVKTRFLKTYISASDKKIDMEAAINNMSYIFLLYSLWNIVRPETVFPPKTSRQASELKEKLDYLITMSRTIEASLTGVVTQSRIDTFFPDQHRTSPF